MKINLFRPAIFTLSILLIPLFAMQFTSEVQWTPFDFVAMGTLIFVTGLAYEFLIHKTPSRTYRAGAALAAITCLLLTWMNLAVGIIGNEDNPANLFYVAIPLILFLGALWARFETARLAHAVFVTAGALALIPPLAFLITKPSVSTEAEVVGIFSVLLLNTFFVVLLLASGFLFKRATT